METEKESKVTDSVILDNITVQLLPIAVDLEEQGTTRSSEQKVEGKERVQGFVEAQRGNCVVIFTDGSVNEEYSGAGSCTAILKPL